jgi:hypothetical protein
MTRHYYLQQPRSPRVYRTLEEWEQAVLQRVGRWGWWSGFFFRNPTPEQIRQKRYRIMREEALLLENRRERNHIIAWCDELLSNGASDSPAQGRTEGK